jgi:thioredoxin-related protein
MHKFLIILFLVGFSTLNSSFGQQKNIDLNWQNNFKEAKQLAAAQHKLILIYFTGSDWSKPSQMLNKDFFYTDKFQKIAAQNLILVRINSPRRPDLISNFQQNKNSELKKRYHQKVFPTIILTDADGKLLGRLESYNYLHDTSKHFNLINNIIKNNL